MLMKYEYQYEYEIGYEECSQYQEDRLDDILGPWSYMQFAQFACILF